MKRIFQAKEQLKHDVKIAYLENYDMKLGMMITSGVDLWLNTPQPPMEASGTSGMKAALNGVPSLSVLDGWWIEGHIEGVTGWSIGETNRRNEEGLFLCHPEGIEYRKGDCPLFYLLRTLLDLYRRSGRIMADACRLVSL
jgi:glucan phosphorylase